MPRTTTLTILLDPAFELDGKGPPVELFGGAVSTPAFLEFTATDPNLPYAVRIRTELQDERYVIARVTVEQLPGGIPVQAAPLREVPVTDLAYRGNIRFGPNVGPVHGPPGPELRRLGPHDPAVGTAVALTYALARLEGRPEAQAVAERLECSPATAAKFIAAARDDGHLRTTPLHKRGGRPDGVD